MNGNTSRDVDFPSQQEEQEGNLFANDDATDIDEDSDEAPQHHRRVQKHSVEDYSQHQKRAKRLRFPILTHQNGCQMAEEANSASDIVDTVTSLSDWSNFMRGEERIFINPFVKPSENDSLFESYWVKAASKLGWPGLAMQKHAMTFVSHLQEDDRFTCHPSNQEWFRNVKMRGRTDKSFLRQINGILICLTAAGIYPALKAWSTGTFVQPSDFSALTAQSWFDPFTGRNWRLTTWQRLPVVVQKKRVEDMKKRINRLLRDNGFVQEHESRAALEDPDAAEYLGVEVSGDEESEVEDNNSDRKVEDMIDALVASPVEDE
ncbi:hypothetical protein HOY80DRAFT_999417 [Tuber brumale]|nr:hypothetical protein HOY80DRAFT_999417 [Tuber brumale]